MGKELTEAFELLEKERNISKDVIVDAVTSALTFAYKKNYDQAQNVEVEFDEKAGKFTVYAVKEVVETVMDSNLEVSLEDALAIHRAYEIGDHIRFEVTPSNFGRLAAQTAKQVITQRLREAERAKIYEEYIDYEDDLLTATVVRQDPRFVYVNLGRIEAVLTRDGQIPGEHFDQHERIQVYVERVENTTKGPQIYVSRTHPNLVKRLFEQEVPEVYDGTVEIKAIAREAGDRSKVAVYSHNKNVDAVGTVVGPRGQRVQTVVGELNGENMDIIEWSDDPATFIENALNPADVLAVHFVPNEKAAVIIVPEEHLSLAIGRRGQNARLAARLTGYKIDIKSFDEWERYQETDEYRERFEEPLIEDETDEDVADELQTEPLPDESEQATLEEPLTDAVFGEPDPETVVNDENITPDAPNPENDGDIFNQ